MLASPVIAIHQHGYLTKIPLKKRKETKMTPPQNEPHTPRSSFPISFSFSETSVGGQPPSVVYKVLYSYHSLLIDSGFLLKLFFVFTARINLITGKNTTPQK